MERRCGIGGTETIRARKKRYKMSDTKGKKLPRFEELSNSELHEWLCHPGKECEDGCDGVAIPEREAILEAYYDWYSAYTCAECGISIVYVASAMCAECAEKFYE